MDTCFLVISSSKLSGTWISLLLKIVGPFIFNCPSKIILFGSVSERPFFYLIFKSLFKEWPITLTAFVPDYFFNYIFKNALAFNSASLNQRVLLLFSEEYQQSISLSKPLFREISGIIENNQNNDTPERQKGIPSENSCDGAVL